MAQAVRARSSLIDHFSALEDPRQSWKVLYPLEEVLLLVLCAVLSGADDFVEIADWGRLRLGFHHHGALCIAAYGFLAAEKAAIPPSAKETARLTDSWPPRRRRFPPQPKKPPGWSKRLSFPPVTDLAAAPLRTERHVSHSIATLRRRIAHALAQYLPRCPCCTQIMRPPSNATSVL
jgi:hypothetical protein